MTMLSAGDDYPLHQTPRPVRDPGTERNLYDRFFFHGYTADASLFFAVALGLYPGRDVMDAAFSVVTDGVQHNIRGSRRLGRDRLDTRVGPITVRILEPLRRLQVLVDDDESGISADLTFTNRGPAFEEPHYRSQAAYRVTFDITRLTQHGTWDGKIKVGGTTIAVESSQVRGVRDRSWGIRPVGERESGGAPGGGGGFYWLWAPLNFDDECVIWDVNERTDGSRWHESAQRAPSDGLDAAVESCDSEYEIEFKSGTRHAKRFALRLASPSGKRTYELEPMLTFFMQGIGYAHPSWGHGMWVGEDVRAYDQLPADSDESAPLHQHVQALCRVTRDDGAVGMGTLEQLIFGPHAPSGFTQVLDFAP